MLKAIEIRSIIKTDQENSHKNQISIATQIDWTFLCLISTIVVAVRPD